MNLKGIVSLVGWQYKSLKNIPKTQGNALICMMLSCKHGQVYIRSRKICIFLKVYLQLVEPTIYALGEQLLQIEVSPPIGLELISDFTHDNTY